MTEPTTAAPAAAPEAPSAPPVTPAAPEAAPAQPPAPETPKGPANAREAMQAIRAGRTAPKPVAPAAEPAKEVNAAGRVVEEQSKQFVAGEPRQEVTPPAGEPPKDPAAVPDGFVRLAVPEGHPLRARGVEALTFPKDQEEYGRWALNQAVRAQQVEEYQTRLTQATKEKLRVEAEARFWRENAGQFFNTDFYDKYERIKAEWGEEEAERYKNGVMVQAQNKLQEVTRESEAEFESHQIREQGQAFQRWAVDDAREKFPAFFGSDGQPRPELGRALQLYASQIQASGVPTLDQRAWYNAALYVYQQMPEVRAAMQAARERSLTEAQEKARQAAEEAAAKAEQERLARAATSRRTNPMGALAPVETQVPSVPADGSASPRNARELMQRIRGRRA